jgi:F-type H+-transporting ATPase subunit epsilon
MIKVRVLTPYNVFLEKQCDLVVVPGDDGEFGIMENHIDVVSKMEPGEVRLYEDDKVIESCFVYGGLASFTNNEMSIMADDADNIVDINLKEAEEKFKFYSEEQLLSDQDNSDDLFNKVLLYRRMLEVGQRR